MNKRRSKLQKGILNLLERNKVRTQKEISDSLNKNASSINRSIKLLIKENLVRKNNAGYFLTSKYKEEIRSLDLSKITGNFAISLGENLMQDRKRLYPYHSGIERMIREMNKSHIKEMDVMRRVLGPSFGEIVKTMRIVSGPIIKMKEEMDVMRRVLGPSFGEIAKTMRITSEPIIKMKEEMKMALEPMSKFSSMAEIARKLGHTHDSFLGSTKKLSETFSLFSKNLQASQLISSKISSLNSLSLNSIFKTDIKPLVSSVLNTTKYFQDYSFERIQEILREKELSIIDKNLFKLEASSLIYKNLSYSIPYPIEKEHPEIKDFEIDFSIEAVKNRKLKKILISIDPNLDRMREGAWETLYSDNPDKCRQSATSMIEFLDWTLRKLAPNKKVKEHSNIEEKDKITRDQKIEYILNSRRSDKKIIEFFRRNIIEIHKLLNNPKHSLEYFDEKQLESLFYMVEGIILFLIKSKS